METRERLITSTQALLWERGYVGTSPKAIQQRAGVGQGSMYHHFGGKADLALAAIQRCAEQLKAFTETRLVRPGSAYSRIESFLLEERQVEKVLKPEDFDRGCLLCSEAKPDHCHRRLAAEWLKGKWEGVKMTHI